MNDKKREAMLPFFYLEYVCVKTMILVHLQCLVQVLQQQLVLEQQLERVVA